MRPLRGLKVRALLLLGGMLLVYALLVAAVDVHNHYQSVRADMLSRMTSLARMASGTASASLAAGDLVNLKRILVDTSHVESLRRMEVYDLEKTTLLNAEEESWLSFQPVQEPLARQALRHQHISTRDEAGYLHVAAPIMVGDTLRGVLFMEADTTARDARLHDRMLDNLLLTLGFMLIATPVLAMLLERLMAQLRALTAAIGHVSRGHFDVPPLHGHTSEMSRLYRAFRRMTLRLQRSLGDVRQLAYTDPVTGLANREMIQRTANAVFATSRPAACVQGFMFIDLDGFKRINDVMGHDMGDRLLSLVGDRLCECLSQAGFDVLAPMADLPRKAMDHRFAATGRLGGDEFVVIASFPDGDGVEELATTLNARLASAFEIEGRRVEISASIGIARFGHDGTDFRTLMRHADLAMYQAKDNGRNGFCCFRPEMASRVVDRMVMEMELKKALAMGEIVPFFMPKYNLADGSLNSFEVLARWNHPKKGTLSPAVFMELAGETALEVAIDRTVMRQACRISAAWADRGIRLPVAVNVGAAHIEQADFAEEVEDILFETGLDGNLLEIEVTESVAMHHPDAAVNAMIPLKQVGVRFAIDDFGTGYSNLAQLMRLPVDVFKLDRSLVDGAEKHGDGYILIRAIVDLAKDLGLEIVAEGIEREEQRGLAASLGCHVGQGYLFGAPMCVADVEALVAADRQRISLAG